MNKFSLNEIIETAVQIERSGYAYYDSALKRNDLTSKGKELLDLLKCEELKHEKTFLQLRDSEDEIKLSESQDWETVGNYLQTLVDSRLFNTPDSAIKLATESNDEKEILKNALTFEKDTILYFHGIEDNVSDEKSKKILRKIINEEISHVMHISKMLEKLS